MFMESFKDVNPRQKLFWLMALWIQFDTAEEAGREPLSSSELRFFMELVDAKAADIVTKWIDYFVLHKSVRPERITQRLK